ncbi:MAG TPA: hypothetical protein VGK94_08200 [Candidatus Polarisedimenticolia bacterium]|jgi:hypothetical protein
MHVLMFELAGATYALKLEAVDRILAPGESLPAGCDAVDVAGLLNLGEVPAGHVALLAGRFEALVIGRPVGTAHIDPSWILPLPGYMFPMPEPPVRGIIEIPARRRGRAGRPAITGRSLLLDEELLLRMRR